MRTLRARLILSHILPILIVVPLLGLVFHFIVSTQTAISDLEALLAQEADRLADQATLIAKIADEMTGIWSSPALADQFLADLDLELTSLALLDSGGQMLANQGVTDSLSTGDMLKQEIVAAILAGEHQVQIQIQESNQGSLVNIVVPVIGANQRLNGIIYMTQQLGVVRTRFQNVSILIAGTILASLLMGIALGSLFGLRLEGVLMRVREAIVDIAYGQAPQMLPEQKVIEIEQLYQSVNALVERLHSLEEARRRLLANLVHELGRPLGSLKSAIDALQRGADQEPGLRQELLTGMANQIDSMQPLLEELTQLHSQIIGTLELNRLPTATSQWLGQLLSLWRELAHAKGLRWSADIPLDLPILTIDTDQLGRAIGNLCSNAIKFTPAGGTIRITTGVKLAVQEKMWWFQISDNGPGIHPDDLAQIFEPFQRGQMQRNFPQGMGLGLTIARDVVEAHGGRIVADSTLGQGSRFTVSLPASQPNVSPEGHSC